MLRKPTGYPALAGRIAVGLLLAVASTSTLPAPAQEVMREDEIVNFWDYLQQFVEPAFDTMRNPAPRMVGRFPVAPPYGFERIEALNTGILIKAMHQRIQHHARTGQKQGLRDRVIAANIQATMTYALEYYPMLHRRPSDFRPIRQLILGTGTHPSMRMFVLRRSVPGYEPPSLFSNNLHLQLALDDPGTARLFGELLTIRTVEERIAVFASELYYQHLYAKLARAVVDSPIVVRASSDVDAALAARIREADSLDLPPTQAVARDAALALLADYRRVLLEEQQPTRRRSDRIVEAYSSLLAQMRAEVPLPTTPLDSLPNLPMMPAAPPPGSPGVAGGSFPIPATPMASPVP